MMVSWVLSMAVVSSSGGLLAERLPSGVHLLDAPSVIPQAMLGARGGDPTREEVEAMSLAELDQESFRLDHMKGASIGVGVLVLVLSTILFPLAGILLYFGGIFNILIAILGIAVGVMGIVVGIQNIVNGSRRNARKELVSERIRILQQPPQAPSPPPPAPAAPEGAIPRFEPQLTLASF